MRTVNMYEAKHIFLNWWMLSFMGMRSLLQWQESL